VVDYFLQIIGQAIYPVLFVVIIGLIIGFFPLSIAIAIIVLVCSFGFQGCQALNARIAVSTQNKNEMRYNKLSQNLEHANNELNQYAESLGLRPGVCTSILRYGLMVPCSIGLTEGSGPTEQIFCPWSEDYHGCTISLDPQNNPKNLFSSSLKISASAKSDSQGETYNNSLPNSTIGNFANKVNDSTQMSSQHIDTNRRYDDALSEAIVKIQELLEAFDKEKPAATENEKIEYVSNETTPNFKRRAAKALLAGGDRAIEEFLDNPYLNIAKSIINSWMDSAA
jgi:hypothetical protein